MSNSPERSSMTMTYVDVVLPFMAAWLLAGQGKGETRSLRQR
jgi:hypothetical protein